MILAVMKSPGFRGKVRTGPAQGAEQPLDDLDFVTDVDNLDFIANNDQEDDHDDHQDVLVSDALDIASPMQRTPAVKLRGATLDTAYPIQRTLAGERRDVVDRMMSDGTPIVNEPIAPAGKTSRRQLMQLSTCNIQADRGSNCL